MESTGRKFKELDPSERYSFSVTTFTQGGAIPQLKYASRAVSKSAPAIGFVAPFGGVIVAEKRLDSPLALADTFSKVEAVNKWTGICYSGIGPDFRVLLKQARKVAQVYHLQHGIHIPTIRLVEQLGAVLQEYTQSGGVRPFGVGLLVCGWDDGKPVLYQIGPSGAYASQKFTAIGYNSSVRNQYLKDSFKGKDDSFYSSLQLKDLVIEGILALKVDNDGTKADNVEVGAINRNGFQKLSLEDMRAYENMYRLKNHGKSLFA